MPPDQFPSPASPIAEILEDFRAAGITPTPLALISVATDRGIAGDDLTAIVAEIATYRGLDEVAA